MAALMEKRLKDYMEVRSGFGDPEVKERMLAKEFHLFDTDKSGAIDFDEFCAVLKKLNCLGTIPDIDELFGMYDADCSGSITYKELCAGLFFANAAAVPNKEPNATKNIVTRVKNEITNRGGGAGLRSAAVLLKRMDKDKSGSLDRGELKEGLEEMGVENLQPFDIDLLMRAFGECVCVLLASFPFLIYQLAS
jgi:Ca2+-binding EF-hand superfamily protein